MEAKGEISSEQGPVERQAWGGLRPTSSHQPANSWEQLLAKICECHVFTGAFPDEVGAWANPDQHEDFCPSLKADGLRAEIKAQFQAEK